jgi:FdhD protein
MAILRYQGLQASDKKLSGVEDNLIVEEALNIRVNGEIFTVTMQTPGHEEDLVRGLLFSEGITDANAQVGITSLESNDLGFTTLINAEVESYDASDLINKRALLSAAACGICGARELEIPKGDSLKIATSPVLNELPQMFEKMASSQIAFEASGGSHAAAAFDNKGNMLSLREDVGRHNAVDKVVGNLLSQDGLDGAKVLLVSGRVSYEIVSKCFRAKIPVLAAVSAPSSLSVDFAKEFGITLIGFAREERFTIYSHPERLVISDV